MLKSILMSACLAIPFAFVGDEIQAAPAAQAAMTHEGKVVSVGAQAIGPVFTRVWNTPNNGYAERFKHTIEPAFSIQRTSAVDSFDRIIQTDSIDSIIGTTAARSASAS
jgi:hypothetical protein